MEENKSMSDEQMFFIPSLLSRFGPETDHPSIQYYASIESKYGFNSFFFFQDFDLIFERKNYTRVFKWGFQPEGFFPRLLLRLVHLRLTPLTCWLDAAVFMGREGGECAFMKLSHSFEENQYTLKVCLN